MLDWWYFWQYLNSYRIISMSIKSSILSTPLWWFVLPPLQTRLNSRECPMHLPLNDYLDHVNWGEKSCYHGSIPWLGFWIKKREKKGAKQQDAFITLYFLIMDVMWPVALSFRCFLHNDGLIPLNCKSLKNPFFLKLLLLRVLSQQQVKKLRHSPSS